MCVSTSLEGGVVDSSVCRFGTMQQVCLQGRYYTAADWERNISKRIRGLWGLCVEDGADEWETGVNTADVSM